MTFTRTGECNQCGECCGYPRSTNKGQNNPWPLEWPNDVGNWLKEDIEEALPIFKLVGHPNYGGKKYGSFKLEDGSIVRWIWVRNHGLCMALHPYNSQSKYDQRCPFLSSKINDKAPCLLYGGKYHEVWEKLCQPTPPETYDVKEQVDAWFENCPSCSFRYE